MVFAPLCITSCTFKALVALGAAEWFRSCFSVTENDFSDLHFEQMKGLHTGNVSTNLLMAFLACVSVSAVVTSDGAAFHN